MTGQQIYEMFERIAPGYDRFNRWASLGLDRVWRRRTAALAEPARSVLDLCCGSGELAFECARFADEVVGIDFSRSMLERARKKLDLLRDASAAATSGARAAGNQSPKGFVLKPGTEVRFLSADARALPFPDGRFDAVVSAFALRNITPGLARSFKEIHRVLNPQGRAVLLDFSRPRFWPLKMGHELYISTVMPLIGFAATGHWRPFAYLRRSIQGFLDPALVCEELSESGFPSAQFIPLHGGIVGIYLAEKGISR